MAGELPDIIHAYLYFFGVWEPGITRAYQLHLRPGDVCIDIGANVGAHTLLGASLVGNTGRVHAIEASPSIYSRLKHNLDANHCMQVQAHNAAVTDTTGPVTIFLHDPQNLGGTTIMAAVSRERPTQAEVVVEGDRLSAIVPLPDLQAARLIKMDVEGAEWCVLRGMRDVLPLLRDDCLIIVEVSRPALEAEGLDFKGLLDFMAGFGLQPVEIANHYDPKFYCRVPGRVFNANIHMDASMLDLGFARPPVINALLEADRLWAGRPVRAV